MLVKSCLRNLNFLKLIKENLHINNAQKTAYCQQFIFLYFANLIQFLKSPNATLFKSQSASNPQPCGFCDLKRMSTLNECLHWEKAGRFYEVSGLYARMRPASE